MSFLPNKCQVLGTAPPKFSLYRQLAKVVLSKVKIGTGRWGRLEHKPFRVAYKSELRMDLGVIDRVTVLKSNMKTTESFRAFKSTRVSSKVRVDRWRRDKRRRQMQNAKRRPAFQLPLLYATTTCNLSPSTDTVPVNCSGPTRAIPVASPCFACHCPSESLMTRAMTLS